MVLRLMIMRKLHEKVNTNFKIITILSLKMEPIPSLWNLEYSKSLQLRYRDVHHFAKTIIGAPAREVAHHRTNHSSVRSNWLFSALLGLLCHSQNVLNTENLGYNTRLREKVPRRTFIASTTLKKKKNRKRWNYIPKMSPGHKIGISGQSRAKC